jgi:hypothetical protein
MRDSRIVHNQRANRPYARAFSSGGIMTRRVVSLLCATVLITGCIDQSRVNDTCAWTDAVAGPLDLSRAADREHLRQDAEIANELMVRVGDAHGRNRPDLQRPYREQCMNALRDTIQARHGVTAAQIHAAERDRVWWADILVVFLPFALIGAFATDRIVRGVCRHFDSDDRAMATVFVIVLIPLTAAIVLGAANFWAFGVEGWRLHNGHVSNRAFLIPIATHGWASFFASLLVCAVAGVRRFRRTPLVGSRRRAFVPRRAA